MPQSIQQIMAQPNFFKFPASFEFRIAPANWQLGHARIVDWHRNWDGAPDTDNLTAEVRSHGRYQRFKLDVGTLPEDIYERLFTPRTWTSAKKVKEICRSFVLEVIVNWHLHFDSDRMTIVDPTPDWPLGDAWEMRKEFLEMRNETPDFLAFLNKWGNWSDSSAVEFVQEIRSKQTDLPRRMLDKNSEHLGLFFSPFFTRIPEYPHFSIRTSGCYSALETTLLIDFLNGVEHDQCARTACKKIFPIISRHKRLYCCQYCAHLESIRRGRERKRRHTGE